ncbi:MAG: TonB-dependent receptor [Gammaproteobacteria bacterium]|nr:TonB-dependent receptor [Gammaproteobacteria bacterium]
MTQSFPGTYSKLSIASIISINALLPLIALAEESNNIPKIVITANRTANTVDETTAPVSIITKKDIERLQAQSVMDILQSIPGIDMTSSGGRGSKQSIHMRGTNSNHILVLVDGTPIGSATLGTTPFEYIPISQVERIEVVRGPHSSLYGSAAIGGVIQIFTNKGQSEQQAFANVGYGSDSTEEYNIGTSGGNSKSTYSLSLGYQETNGYNFYGESSPHTDDDGFDNTSLSLSGSHKFTEAFKISGNYLYSEGTNEYDPVSSPFFPVGSENPYRDYKEEIATITADYEINQIWSTQFLFGHSTDKSEDHTSFSSETLFKTTKNNYSWKNEFLINDKDLLTLGIDYLDESIDSSADYDEDSRWNKAVFAQYQYYGNVFDFKISGRHDDNKSFGGHTTGSLSFGFDLDENVRVTSSYGTAFVVPSFNELYYPGFGNDDLKPEESESFDFGLEGKFNSVSWTANFYKTSITDLIVFPPPTYVIQNKDKANIDGLELTLQTKLINWTVSASASFTDPVDNETGDILDNRSKNHFRLDLDSHFGKFNYGASVVAASERYLSGEKNLSGYGVMNLRGSYHFNKHWTLKAKVDNLFDKDYATNTAGDLPYKAQDRYVFTSIHYQM